MPTKSAQRGCWNIGVPSASSAVYIRNAKYIRYTVMLQSTVHTPIKVYSKRKLHGKLDVDTSRDRYLERVRFGAQPKLGDIGVRPRLLPIQPNGRG